MRLSKHGFRIPQFAVVGASCTGKLLGPAPSGEVKAELEGVRKILRCHKIRSRYAGTATQNCFCGKVWVVVSGETFDQARALAEQYLEDTRESTRFIHDALS